LISESEGKDLRILNDDELLEAKAYHETKVLNHFGRSDEDRMHAEEELASSVVREMFRRTDESPTMQFIKKSLEDVEVDWGIKISNIQFKDISFDQTMNRAMAVKAEADRSAEAKLINATADIKTAELYAKAAEIYKENPITLRLREFQLWNSISKNPNSTIYVVPSNLLDFIKNK